MPACPVAHVRSNALAASMSISRPRRCGPRSMRHWARRAAIFFAAALLVIAMIGMEECATFARLSPDEMLMGAALSAHNRGLLASYKFNLERGAETVRDMIAADLRCFLDLGSRRQAADALLVLRSFLSDHPDARHVPRQQRSRGA